MILRFQAKCTAALLASAALGASALAQAPTQTPPAAPTPEQMQPAPPPSEAQSPQAATTETVTVGTEEIRSFVMALAEVDKIQKQYRPQLESAAAEQRPAIEQEANARMTAAVEAQGLEPQTFNAIATAAQEDPKLRNRIQAEAAKMQPAEPTGR